MLPSIPHWDYWNIDKNNNHKAVILEPDISWRLIWLHFSILHISSSLFKLSSCCLNQEKKKKKNKHEESPRWNSTLQKSLIQKHGSVFPAFQGSKSKGWVLTPNNRISFHIWGFVTLPLHLLWTGYLQTALSRSWEQKGRIVTKSMSGSVDQGPFWVL